MPSPWQLTVFARRQVQPPTSVYVTPQDILIFRIASDHAVTFVEVNWRFLTPRGDVQYNTEQWTFETAGKQLRIRPLDEGYLLGMEAHAYTATPGEVMRGQVWLTVGIGKGTDLSATELQMLIQDYLSRDHIASWPRGRYYHPSEGPGDLAVFEISNSTGVDIAFEVGPNELWRPMSAIWTLATDATAVEREMSVRFDQGSGSGIYYRTGMNVPHPPSTTLNYSGGTASVTSVTPRSVVSWHFPRDFKMGPNHRLTTLTINLQGGDAFTAARIYVERWQSPQWR